MTVIEEYSTILPWSGDYKIIEMVEHNNCSYRLVTPAFNVFFDDVEFLHEPEEFSRAGFRLLDDRGNNSMSVKFEELPTNIENVLVEMSLGVFDQ